MTRIHHKRLLVSHLAQILHHKTILCPVLEDGSVATVDDKFVRMLCHLGIEVVLNHKHDAGSLLRAMRILVNGSCIHIIMRTITIHIDTSVLVELFHKLGSQLCMQVLREITQRITQGKLSFLGCEYLFALRRMINVIVVGQHFRQIIRNAQSYFFCKGHNVKRLKENHIPCPSLSWKGKDIL